MQKGMAVGTGAYFLIGAIALAALATLLWRLASHRCKLPCPAACRWFVELDNPFTKVNRAAFIIDHLDLEPGMTVLDAGCGPGRLTIPLAQAVGPDGQVLAMDMQEKMLSRVKAKAEAARLSNIAFLRAGIGDGELEPDRFDRIVLVTVLGEVPERREALAELFHTLKPGGLLSVTEAVFDPHYMRRRTVTDQAGKAGFRDAAFHGSWVAYVLNLEKPKL